ncbi:MAG: VWA domain-containing protein [Verrucomicrobiota bacterium]
MSGFVFLWPVALLLLLLVFPIAALLRQARLERARILSRLSGSFGGSQRTRDYLRLAAFVLLVLGLSRPAFSPGPEYSLRTNRDIVFLLDVSRSMLAEDLYPSRLEVAKQSIRDALDVFSSERVGLVIYAGSASILCPLTYDYGFVRYMLNQVQPRSVDFGGTTLQAAVEKAVDQVFIEGRSGVQDLIVITDGGDHGSNVARVVEIIEESGASALIVGIGDPNNEVLIPIVGDDGSVEPLEVNGEIVTTRLEDSSLRSFAAMTPNIEYVSPGIEAFHLGALYETYAAEKDVRDTDEVAELIVYKEGFAVFLAFALILLVVADLCGRRVVQLAKASLLLSVCFWAQESDAEELQFRNDFEKGVGLMEEGAFEDALLQFSLLYSVTDFEDVPKGDLAALQLNRGLCLIEISRSLEKTSPRTALSHASEARLSLLSAKRYSPEMNRSSALLDSLYDSVVRIQAIIDSQERAEEEITLELQLLVEKLEVFRSEQVELHDAIIQGRDRQVSKQRVSSNEVSLGEKIPFQSPAYLQRSLERQSDLLLDSLEIGELMRSIDQKLASLPTYDESEPVTILRQPLVLMDRVIESGEKAEVLIADRGNWPAARVEQKRVEKLVTEILDLLAGGSSQEPSSNENPEDYSEDYDYEDWNEDQEGMVSSDAVAGDFAADSEMQSLPIPDYSVEDILREERGSLQFRQQKRANANAGNVEKDY